MLKYSQKNIFSSSIKLGPNWSKLVQNGPNMSKKDKYKDQAGHGFDLWYFFGFLLHAEKCQNMPRSAKQFPKVKQEG